MAFEKGSLIMVDYTARIKDTGEVFDTTSEADARAASIYEEGARYSPRIVSVGELAYPVLRGFDEALAGASVGERLTVEVTPDKGFGERNPKEVRMVPVRKLGDDAEKVEVGDTVEIGDRRGIIRFIGSGRVQVDYNHRYAGKAMVFEATVTRSLDSPEDRIGGILEGRFKAGRLEFELDGGAARVEIPEGLMRADGLQITKHMAQADIFRFVPGTESVSFVETHVNRARAAGPPEEAERPAEQPAERPPAPRA